MRSAHIYSFITYCHLSLRTDIEDKKECDKHCWKVF